MGLGNGTASAIINGTVGLFLVLAIIGIGRGILRLALRERIPSHWYVSFSLLVGLALASVSIQLVSFSKAGSNGLRAAFWAILVAGLVGHAVSRKKFRSFGIPKDKWALSLLLTPVSVLLLIALAPSTKIDELHYHMLVGRRIVENGGFKLYQLPYEQAMTPQLGYQILESIFHAIAHADAGNVLSLAFSIALLFLIHGVVLEAAGNQSIALFSALACAIGLYPAVWHVTAGPHALGDLATASAVAIVFFPGPLQTAVSPTVRIGLLSLACAVAASTKISLIGIVLALNVYAVSRWKTERVKALGLALAIWAFVLGPLIAWSLVYTGVPFGAVFADALGSNAFQPVVFQEFANAKAANQVGFVRALIGACTALNGGVLLLFCAGIWCSITRVRDFGLLLALFVLQFALIALFLPHDFRFLGGLQYGFVILGGIFVTPLLSRDLIKKRMMSWCAPFLLLPWFAAEAYYAVPFMAVDFGVVGREAFLRRYVAYWDDFHRLDALLPRDAKIFAPGLRLPSFYTPRPVIFTLADWDHRSPLFFFTTPADGEAPQSTILALGLTCEKEVYHNEGAIGIAFRTPRRAPGRTRLFVFDCR